MLGVSLPSKNQIVISHNYVGGLKRRLV